MLVIMYLALSSNLKSDKSHRNLIVPPLPPTLVERAMRIPQPGKIVFDTMSYRRNERAERSENFHSKVSFANVQIMLVEK